MNAQKLAAIKQNVRIGGKGTPRRKKKIQRKRNVGADDKRIQAALKNLGAQPLQGIEEVNLFKDDGEVIHFSNPKFHVGSGGTNMYAVSGRAETKKIQDILPDLLKTAEQAAAAAGGGDDEVPELVENFSTE